jgi:hypothetical protein
LAAKAASDRESPKDRAACVAAVLRALPPSAGSPLWASQEFLGDLVGVLARAVELGFRTALEQHEQHLLTLAYAPCVDGLSNGTGDEQFNGTGLPLPPPVTLVHIANAALVALQESRAPPPPPGSSARPLAALLAVPGLPGGASLTSALAALDVVACPAFSTATAPEDSCKSSCDGITEDLYWISPESLRLGAIPALIPTERGKRVEHALALGLRVGKEQPPPPPPPPPPPQEGEQQPQQPPAGGAAPSPPHATATVQVAMLGLACTPLEGSYDSSAVCYGVPVQGE